MNRLEQINEMLSLFRETVMQDCQSDPSAGIEACPYTDLFSDEHLKSDDAFSRRLGELLHLKEHHQDLLLPSFLWKGPEKKDAGKGA